MDYNAWRFEEERLASDNREAKSLIGVFLAALISDVFNIIVVTALTLLAFEKLPTLLICLAILHIAIHVVGVPVGICSLSNAKKIYRDGIKAIREFHEKYPMPDPEE